MILIYYSYNLQILNSFKLWDHQNNHYSNLHSTASLLFDLDVGDGHVTCHDTKHTGIRPTWTAWLLCAAACVCSGGTVWWSGGRSQTLRTDTDAVGRCSQIIFKYLKISISSSDKVPFSPLRCAQSRAPPVSSVWWMLLHSHRVRTWSAAVEQRQHRSCFYSIIWSDSCVCTRMFYWKCGRLCHAVL